MMHCSASVTTPLAALLGNSFIPMAPWFLLEALTTTFTGTEAGALVTYDLTGETVWPPVLRGGISV